MTVDSDDSFLKEAATMSISVAQLRHIFGLRREVTGNVAYHDEQTIVYPSGTNCVLYNIDQKQQKFIQGSEKSRPMTAMALSQNRRYVAIAERGDKEKGKKIHILCKFALLFSLDNYCLLQVYKV